VTTVTSGTSDGFQ